PTLVAKLKAEEDRKRSLAREMENIQHDEAVTALDADEVRERVRKKAADLRGVLKRGTPDARAALAKLLSGKLDAEPVVIDGRRGYRLTGNVNVTGLLPDAMISRLQARMSNSPLVVAPRGFDIQTCYRAASRTCPSRAGRQLPYDCPVTDRKGVCPCVAQSRGPRLDLLLI